MKTKFFSTLGILFATVCSAYAQQTFGTGTSSGNASTTASTVWNYIIVFAGLFVGITTVVGIVTVYNAKSSSQPDEFKKKMMNWIWGVLFLWVAFGLLTSIIAIVKSASNQTF